MAAGAETVDCSHSRHDEVASLAREYRSGFCPTFAGRPARDRKRGIKNPASRGALPGAVAKTDRPLNHSAAKPQPKRMEDGGWKTGVLRAHKNRRETTRFEQIALQ